VRFCQHLNTADTNSPSVPQQWITVAVAEATVGWSKCGPYQIATDF
jgi:hypothetical protein